MLSLRIYQSHYGDFVVSQNNHIEMSYRICCQKTLFNKNGTRLLNHQQILQQSNSEDVKIYWKNEDCAKGDPYENCNNVIGAVCQSCDS